ncbi:MAG: MotA/TolQ/ExbB proton channel family protein [Firmicutes bacterium]|nr:MotA/TolQ/ExbB proton channel family protein [Bacillota bacterium]
MMEFFAKGGPILVILVVMSILSLALIIERFLAIHKVKRQLRKQSQPVQLEVEASWPEPARPILQEVYVVLQRDPSDEAMEKVRDRALEKVADQLESHLDLVAMTINLAPLLGLMGTVTGMISTFTVFSELGSRQPQLLAGGISEALLTTAAGLAIAIMNTALHHYLIKQVDGRLAEIEELCDQAVVSWRERGSSDAASTTG